MLNIAARLRRACIRSIEHVYPSLKLSPEKFSQPVYDSAEGYYRVTHAFVVAEEQRKENAQYGISQRIDLYGISMRFASQLPEELIDHEKTKPLQGGVLCLHLPRSVVSSAVKEIVLAGVSLPELQTGSRRRVVVDFSSPNIAKDLHVGHLRSTVIGDSLCRLLDFVGHDVIRLNHVGDWGTQQGMVIAHLSDQNKDSASENENQLSITDLQQLYRDAKSRFDYDKAFRERALATVVRLQKGENFEMRVWKILCNVSRKAFLDLYQRLDVTITERGESFYSKVIPELMEWLNKKDALHTDESGRQVMPVNGKSMPLLLVKSDGGYTYSTTDLAALWHRVHHINADWIIYVVDQGQSLHFELLFKAAEQAGLLKGRSVQLDHVSFGLVKTEDRKRIRTRSGDTVRLLDLLDTSVERAEKILEKKKEGMDMSPEEFVFVKEALAYSSVRYYDLLRNRKKGYVFSFDKMLNPKGNTAIYLLYAYARMRAISRLVKMSNEDIQAAAKKATVISLEHPGEWRLAGYLLTFPEAVDSCVSQLSMHPLCSYLHELSSLFSQFYNECYVVDTNPNTKEVLQVHESRVLLCHAVAEVMKKGFDLLGIRAVERM